MYLNRKKEVFSPVQIPLGTQVKGIILRGGSHPPRNRILQIVLILIIFLYSPRKNRANPREEYSTLYPATSSASASGRSKGARFVSARQQMKKSPTIGAKGKRFHSPLCLSTMSLRFRLPTGSTTVSTTRPILTS
jgi:hypothetical protein